MSQTVAQTCQHLFELLPLPEHLSPIFINIYKSTLEDVLKMLTSPLVININTFAGKYGETNGGVRGADNVTNKDRVLCESWGLAVKWKALGGCHTHTRAAAV